MKAGDVAGNTNLNGYYIITLAGRPYNALPLALYYATGEWPEGRVTPKDEDRGNAIWTNIRHEITEPSNTRQARYMRGYRDRIRAERKDSPIEGIVWSEPRQLWTVRLPGRPSTFADGHAKSFEDAVRLYYARLHGVARVEALPAPPITPDFERRYCDVRHTGEDIKALSLADLHRAYCYDPIDGTLYLRREISEVATLPSRNAANRMTPKTHAIADPEFSKGIRVDQPGYAGTRVLRFKGRDYPVHMIAAFFVLGHWVPPRFVRFANGDQTNPAWENLLFEGKPSRFRFFTAPPAAAPQPEEAPRDRRRKPLESQ